MYEHPKYQFYQKLAEDYTRKISSDIDLYKQFLKFSSKLYRYRFEDLILIFAQNPNATAVASFEQWNTAMHRYIKRGSKGIALLDVRSDRNQLKYVFDIADTGERTNSRHPWEWKIDTENHDRVLQSLIQWYNLDSSLNDMQQVLDTVAMHLAEKYWENHKRDILYGISDSSLNDTNEIYIHKNFIQAVYHSSKFQMLNRFGMDPESSISDNELYTVFEFDSIMAAGTVGKAIKEVSTDVFEEVANMVRSINKEKYIEEVKHGRDQLHKSGRLLSSGFESEGSKKISPKMGDDEKRLSGRVSTGTLHQFNDVRSDDGLSAGHGGYDRSENGNDHESSRREKSATGEGKRPDGLGRTYEHAERDGGGIHSERVHIRHGELSGYQGVSKPTQLSLFDFIPSQEEQIQAIESMESREKEEPTRSETGNIKENHIGEGKTPSPILRKEEKIPDTDSTSIRTGNFQIKDSRLGIGGAKQKFQTNILAIQLLKQIESEGRKASLAEQEILSRYVGWGGLSDAFDSGKANWSNEYLQLKKLLTEDEYEKALSSTTTAFYTNPNIIKAMYGAIAGFYDAEEKIQANILEPSMGVGNFFGLLPEQFQESNLYGIELDDISGRIAKLLYPDAQIRIGGYETYKKKDFFDIAIGNVPFGDFSLADKEYDKLNLSIHEYFFVKALDQLKAGGILAFITSRFLLDKESQKVRKLIASKAELIGAVRLPENTFWENAGTKVVSDIIFLRKREKELDVEPDWVHTNPINLSHLSDFSINQYFIDHPQMVLGSIVPESTRYGMSFTVKPNEEISLFEELQQAFQSFSYRIQERIQNLEAFTELKPGFDVVGSVDVDDVKNFSFTIVGEEVYFRRDDRLAIVSFQNQQEKDRVMDLILLRNTMNELMDFQLQNVPEETILLKREELNTQYDDFTKTFGRINSKKNEKAFSEDSSYYLLCSLEHLNQDKSFKAKADIFFKRTIRPIKEIRSVDNAVEALEVSIGMKGRVDIPYMAKLLNTSDFKAVTERLRGIIYHLPSHFDDMQNGWVTADEYLSGNLREKLMKAKQVATHSTEYLINVHALEEAMPRQLDAHEIDIRIGATWIAPKYINDFMYEVFQVPYYLQRSIKASYSKDTAEWFISGKKQISSNHVLTNMTYGTSRINAFEILEQALNLKGVKIYDKKINIDGKEQRVLNYKQTMFANEKMDAMQLAFKEWIFKDPTRKQDLVHTFNVLFNSTKYREYNGDHITFFGMNPDIHLFEHQKNAIAHVLYGGNTLLAHEVGAGKTFEMVASAMESKRLGLCHKSLFVVPNHLILQCANDFIRLYPLANLLVAQKKDFEPANRKKFCSRIATGDYDAIIIGHSQFERIPLSPQTQERFIREQLKELDRTIDELKGSSEHQFSVKQAVKSKRKLQTKLERLVNEDRKDDVIHFESLGIDRLFVDESHNYKNLFVYTKMSNISGLSTSESQKATDMFLKCRYIDEITNGRGIVFATGTPVSNSISEAYSLMRFLQFDRLKEMGLSHFDAWASTFCKTSTELMLAPEGTGFRERTKLQFHNLPELMNIFKEVADIKTTDQLNLNIPKAEFITILAKPSAIQKDFIQELSKRADKVHSRQVQPHEDNMLKITTDGRKIGLDQRLMNPLLMDDEQSKVNLCVKNVFNIWEEGKEDKLTQLLFCDSSTPQKDGTFNLYDDIKSKLIQMGVPENEIAFIHDAATDEKKKTLFKNVCDGKVRVLIGSTPKMGAGTNVQDRLIALHHLDVAWRPADMTQRTGRIIRQGNKNKHVKVFSYVTEGTFDAYLYQTLENKQKFISQIMTSKSPVRSCDDVDELVLSYSEIKALSTGNPLIKEKMDLDNEVAKLKILRANFYSQQKEMGRKINTVYPVLIERTNQLLKDLKKDEKLYQEQTKDEFSGMEVKGMFYDTKELAGNALLDAVKKIHTPEPMPIGTYKSFAIKAYLDTFGHEMKLSLKGSAAHDVVLGQNAIGNITKIENALKHISEEIERIDRRLDGYKNELLQAKEQINKIFPQERELIEKQSKLERIDKKINIGAKREKQESMEEAER